MDSKELIKTLDRWTVSNKEENVVSNSTEADES